MRGGARNYPKGSAPRPTLTCRVAPETYTAITQLSADLGISQGKVVDELLKSYMEMCEKEG